MPVRREGTLHRIGRFIVLASALACASGSGTQLTDSWHEPSTTQLGFNRTLVVFMSPNASARQMVEDRLASRIPNSVPAYRAVPDLNQGDPAAARRQLQGQGFDGIVAMRVVAVQQSSGEYVAGNNWYATRRDFDSFWGPSWVVVEDPGYRVEHRDVTVETRIFSLAENKLVWAGRTKTENPKSIDHLVESAADAVGAQLRSQGLIR